MTGPHPIFLSCKRVLTALLIIQVKRRSFIDESLFSSLMDKKSQIEYRQNLKRRHTFFGGPILLLIREHFLLENMENVTEIRENVVFNNYTEDDETRIRK